MLTSPWKERVTRDLHPFWGEATIESLLRGSGSSIIFLELRIHPLENAHDLASLIDALFDDKKFSALLNRVEKDMLSLIEETINSFKKRICPRRYKSY